MTAKAIPVHVRLSTEHVTEDGMSQRQQEEHSGHAWLNTNLWVVRFAEQMDGQQTGTTTVKAGDEQLTIIRRGEVTMRQRFEPGEETVGLYGHPYGRMEMATKTEFLRRRVCRDRWQVEWHYQLRMNGVPSGTFHMNLVIDKANL